MEAPHEHALAQNVSIHRSKDIGTSGIRAQGEFRIQGEKFERVVVIWANGRRAGTKIANRSAPIFCLHGSIVKHRSCWNAFGKFGGVPEY